MNRNEHLFGQLLMIFQAAGMQGLGKLVNPMTNKSEVNLEQAKDAIDMLSMLKEYTKGNLSAEQSNLLDNNLSNLRLNYVDEANKLNQ